jgi:RES domain
VLSDDFPHVVWDAKFGQWWRIHSAERGAWWFSSSDEPERDESQIGRFDLPSPFGTCYLAAYLVGGAAESLRETGVSEAAAQAASNERHLSQMPLDRWYGTRIADFTSPACDSYGAPPDIAGLSRAEARPWAIAAHDAGFTGIHYKLCEDPAHRVGLALFHEAGEHPPMGAAGGVALPVGLRRGLTDLFEGDSRGDPLPK